MQPFRLADLPDCSSLLLELLFALEFELLLPMLLLLLDWSRVVLDDVLGLADWSVLEPVLLLPVEPVEPVLLLPVEPVEPVPLVWANIATANAKITVQIKKKRFTRILLGESCGPGRPFGPVIA